MLMQCAGLGLRIPIAADDLLLAAVAGMQTSNRAWRNTVTLLALQNTSAAQGFADRPEPDHRETQRALVLNGAAAVYYGGARMP